MRLLKTKYPWYRQVLGIVSVAVISSCLVFSFVFTQHYYLFTKQQLEQKSARAADRGNSSPLQNINFNTSSYFYDKQDISKTLAGERLAELLIENATSTDWIPSTPGDGKTSLRVAAFIPANYLQQIGKSNLTDNEIASAIKSRAQDTTNQYDTLLSITTHLEDEVFIMHDSRTLSEILCPLNPSICDTPNWELLKTAALTSLANRETNPLANQFIFIFGGGGIADANILMGDWSFGSSLFGYIPPGCAGNDLCGLERQLFTIRHEMAHAYGSYWHSPNYTRPSILGSENFIALSNYEGYPEKNITCRSSLNVGEKNCDDRFTRPNRPDIFVTTIQGRYYNGSCSRFNTAKKVFFTINPYDGVWNRRLLGWTNLLEDGTFSIPINSNLNSWKRSFAIKAADAYPSPDPDVNDFIDGYQIHYNPVKSQWCDDDTDSICYNSQDFVLPAGNDLCQTASLTSTPTPPYPSPTAFVPTPTSTRTPTPTNIVPTATKVPTPTIPNVPTATLTPALVLTSHVGDLDGVRDGLRIGTNWKAKITIRVHTQFHVPLSGVTIRGTWSGANGANSCITTSAGMCTLTSNNTKNQSVTYMVTSATHPTYVYEASENHDPDGDSNGKVIVVYK